MFTIFCLNYNSLMKSLNSMLNGMSIYGKTCKTDSIHYVSVYSSDDAIIIWRCQFDVLKKKKFFSND